MGEPGYLVDYLTTQSNMVKFVLVFAVWDISETTRYSTLAILLIYIYIYICIGYITARVLYHKNLALGLGFYKSDIARVAVI